MKSRSRLWAALILLTLGLPLAAQEAETVTFYQDWEKVEGAGSYRVEIQNDRGQTIFTKEVTDTTVQTDLVPGNYRMRILSLNRFGEVDTETEWTKFVARKIEAPTIQRSEPRTAQETEGFSLRVQVSGSDAKTRWQLVGREAPGTPRPVPAAVQKQTAPQVWQLTFPGLPAGLYNLQAVGRTGKTGEYTGALMVVNHGPLVTGLTPRQIAPFKPATVTLAAQYLKGGESFEIYADDDEKNPVKAPTATAPDGTLTLALPALAPGSYTLRVGASPEVTFRKAFQVMMPAPVIQRVSLQKEQRLIVVQGQNWTPGMRAFLGGTGRQEILVLGQGKQGELYLSYPESTTSGVYDLVLANNQGDEAVVKAAIDVRGSLDISLQALVAEENDAFAVTVKASTREEKLTWTVAGKDLDGREVTQAPQSASLSPDKALWTLQFPGLPQGNYVIKSEGTRENRINFPNTLTVVAHTPRVVTLGPDKVENGTPITLSLVGQYLLTDGRGELVSEKDGAVVKGTWKKAVDTHHGQLEFPALAPGFYHLRITSAQGKSTQVDRALYVLFPLPAVQTVSVQPWDAQNQRRRSVVDGENLSLGTDLYLRRGEKRFDVVKESWSDTSVLLSYPADLPVGAYELVVVNPDGRETAVPRGVVVNPPVALTLTSFAQTAGQPLTLQVSAPGFPATSRWQVLGMNLEGKEVLAEAQQASPGGDSGWTLNFAPLPAGKYHILVTDEASGKRQTLPRPIVVSPAP